MKNLASVAKKTQNVICEDWSTWLPLYYSFENDAVYTTEGEGRYLVTKLINPCSSAAVKAAVERWKRM